MEVGGIYVDIALLALALSIVSLLVTFLQGRRMVDATERMASDNARLVATNQQMAQDNARMAAANEQMAATNRALLAESKRMSDANEEMVELTRRSQEASERAARFAEDEAQRQRDERYRQEQERREQAAAAYIRASIRREPQTSRSGRSRGNCYLDLVNEGQASAFNLNLEAFRPLEEGATQPPIVTDALPFPELRPHDRVSCPIQLWSAMGSTFEVVTTWEDGRGPNRLSQAVAR